MTTRSITLNKGGTAEKTVPLDSIDVPDCWQASCALDDGGFRNFAEKVRECWHLAHDLLRELRKTPPAAAGDANGIDVDPSFPDHELDAAAKLVFNHVFDHHATLADDQYAILTRARDRAARTIANRNKETRGL